MTDDGAPDRGAEPDRLADGSRIAQALTALGTNGQRALGHLRDAQQKLAEAHRWAQPFEGALASCRSAIDSLLKEAGEEFEGIRDAQEQVFKELRAFLRRPTGPTKPMDKLLAALDTSEEPPEHLDPRAGIGRALQPLIKMPSERLPDPGDPGPEYAAVRELLTEVAGLSALPDRPEDQRPLLDVLARLHHARKSGAGTDPNGAAPDGLAGLRAAFTYLEREKSEPGAFRNRQIAHLVQRWTQESPGPGEAEAIRAWARFYRDSSAVLHGKAADGEAGTRMLFEQVVAHVEQLVLDLPDLAPILVALVRTDAPTAEDVEAVARLHQRRAVRYFFTHAESPHWLDLLDQARLLPEADRWPAQPYLQRVAAAEPQKVLAWLIEHQEAFTSADPRVLDGLLRVARAIGAPSSSLVQAVATSPQALDALQPLLIVWLIDIPAGQRDRAWVSVAQHLLVHLLDTPDTNRWEIQQNLVELQAAAYPPDGTEPAVPARAVREALAAGMAAGLAPEAGHDDRLPADLDMVDDLRHVVVADDHGPAVERILARAQLDFARTEALNGVRLDQRTAPWADALPGPRRWADRMVAVHLLEVPAPPGSGEDWDRRALDLLSRIGDVVRVTADWVDFVAAALERRPADDRPNLEAVLATALGPAPTPDELAAGIEALATWPDKRAPKGWSAAWSLAPVLPPAVLEPLQPVVDAVSALLGPPPRRPLPRLRPIPYLDPLRATAQQIAPLVTAKGAPAAAAELLARQRCGDLSPDYARIVLGQLIATEPTAWAASVPAVVGALEEPPLQRAYLAALRTPIASTPCPLPDRAATAGAAAEALWDVLAADTGLADDERGEAELAMALLLRESWALGIDLGALEESYVPWLEAIVAAWSAPTRSTADPLRVADSQLGGIALDALISWGLACAVPPAEVAPPVDGLLETLLADGSDDRVMAVIGSHLPAILDQAPQWADDRATQLFDLEQPSPPAITALITHRFGPASVALLRHLDRAQLAACLRRPHVHPTAVEVCAAVLVVDADALGGQQDFLSLLSTGDGAPAAVSQLLSRTAWVLPQAADENNVAFFDNAAQFWEHVLALDLPGTAGHLHGAGDFAYREGLGDERWLELTARTVGRTTSISRVGAVARRAARHPESAAARSILTGLLPLCDPTLQAGPPSYEEHEIRRCAIELWRASPPESAGREELGLALARYADFLEAVAD
ncbi:hypothetical protein ACFWXO_16605 [Kitasatospora sp. NPDC059088]|uniref:hypothetical protein n=1 Tax=Kitasatospora sp. NPDC059088 TaxID=3346722 RepID=UPI00367B754E